MREKILELFKENEAMMRNCFNDVDGPEFARLAEDIEKLFLPSVIGSQVNADLLDACESLLKAVDDEGWQTDEGGDYEEQIKARRAIKRAKENCR